MLIALGMAAQQGFYELNLPSTLSAMAMTAVAVPKGTERQPRHCVAKRVNDGVLRESAYYSSCGQAS